ncbi:hypothetical protein [Nonomuraea sp. bgisy101]|uniref:hypothetical protein n=1 Tax=Nonomuraea sp. bgisy101 TaxID=3413784 RepID=UPI003D75BB0F
MANRPPFQALQALTPQTIGYALTDSPVGQLACIADGSAQWTGPRSPISDERMLTNISLYWLTATAASSARLHHDTSRALEPYPVPVGVAVFTHDITQPVRPLAELLYDISHWSENHRNPPFPVQNVMTRPTRAERHTDVRTMAVTRWIATVSLRDRGRGVRRDSIG